jgi:hypothetical protein
MEKKTWYTIKDGKIDRVQVTRENEKPLPENLEWKQSPTNNALHPETPVARYDENMRYLTDEEWLKKQGKKDPRGRWHNKETRETKLVYGLDEAVDEAEWTKDAPIDNEPYQKFDGKKNKWVVDAEKKERAEKEAELGKLKSQVSELERKALRPQREKELGIDVEESEKRIREIQAGIEALRPGIKTLEDELKSA